MVRFKPGVVRQALSTLFVLLKFPIPVLSFALRQITILPITWVWVDDCGVLAGLYESGMRPHVLVLQRI